MDRPQWIALVVVLKIDSGFLHIHLDRRLAIHHYKRLNRWCGVLYIAVL